MSERAQVLLFALPLVAAAACATVLGLRPDAPRGFPHREHAEGGVACVECHDGIEHASETGPLHLPAPADCVECHEDPHDDSPCMRCHGGPATARHAAQAQRYVRFRHDQHLESLQGQCVRCHVGVREPGQDLAAPMGVCLACHEHADQFRTRDCDGCHQDLHEERLPPESHLVHGSNFLETHGVAAASAGELCMSCHRESSCAECHGVGVPQLPSRMRFDDPMRPEMHRAGFASRHAEEAAAQPGLCTTCHTVPFCAGCHEDRGVSSAVIGSRNPHPPGWVGVGPADNLHGPAARRDPVSCASCHGGAGEALCIDCHRVGGVGGNPHPPGWESRKPLTDVPCRFCH